MGRRVKPSTGDGSLNCDGSLHVSKIEYALSNFLPVDSDVCRRVDSDFHFVTFDGECEADIAVDYDFFAGFAGEYEHCSSSMRSVEASYFNILQKLYQFDNLTHVSKLPAINSVVAMLNLGGCKTDVCETMAKGMPVFIGLRSDSNLL